MFGSGASHPCAARRSGSLGIEDVEEPLLVEFGELTLCGVDEELGGHVGQHPVVTHGVVGERGGELGVEQGRIAGGFVQVGEAGEEVVARGVLESEP